MGCAQSSRGHPSGVRGPDIHMRLPLSVRLYVGVVAVAWCAVFGTAAFAAGLARSPIVVVPVLALGFGVSVGTRILRLSLAAEGDELVVRNHSSTRRLRRDEIREFRIAGPRTPIPLGRTVQAVLNDGSSLVLDVLARPQLLPSSQRRLSEQMDHLRRWLAG